MKKLLRMVLICMLIIATGLTSARAQAPLGDDAAAAVPARWGLLNAHDPAIFKDGDTYYVFSTDASRGNIHKNGAQIRKSTDLISWEYVGTAFGDVYADCAPAVKHAKLDAARHDGLWAPDVIKVGDKYRLYYSASTFGSSRSAIGLAEADSPTGPYTDKGVVVKSDAGALNGANCIDPALFRDVDGRVYMSYGSFFGGIMLVELGDDGFVKAGAKPARIAGSRGSSIEGSYIVYLKETGYYYLFVSYASLSADYNIRVGRSREVCGPYADANGKPLTDYATLNAERVGTKLLGGFRFNWSEASTHGVKAPGHCSVLVDESGLFLVHHARAYDLDSAWFMMQVRRMAINRFGWLVALPMTYSGEKLEPLDELPEGEYELVEQLSDSNAEPHISKTVTLKGGEISGAYKGSYRLYDGWHAELIIEGVVYDGAAARQTDAETGCEGIGISVSSETGLSLLGFTRY